MERDALKRLLGQVRRGELAVDAAVERLRLEPLEQMEGVCLDLHRALRRGFPEVVYGPGKPPAQVAQIVASLRKAGQTVLVTRVGPEVHQAVQVLEPKAVYHEVPRAITVRDETLDKGRPGVVVISAGSSDVPVAEEAALTAEMMGQQVDRIWDVGVAGLHRLLEHRERLATARVLVVVAGMEGALPSVVTGLTDCPVIGVPTSQGYGFGRPGEAALMAMLHSCAGGLTVVNIDNGFGAGFAAALINGLNPEPDPP